MRNVISPIHYISILLVSIACSPNTSNNQIGVIHSEDSIEFVLKKVDSIALDTNKTIKPLQDISEEVNPEEILEDFIDTIELVGDPIDTTLIQGVWAKNLVDDAIFEIKGDSVYYIRHLGEGYLWYLEGNYFVIELDGFLSKSLIQVTQDSMVLKSDGDVSRLIRIP